MNSDSYSESEESFKDDRLLSEASDSEDVVSHENHSMGSWNSIGSNEDSSFSSDVEFIIGEVGTESIHKSLLKSEVDEEATKPSSSVNLGSVTQGLITSDDKATQGSDKFLQFVGSIPSRIRNLAFIGFLHHGKTSLIRMLSNEKSHKLQFNEEKQCISLKNHLVNVLVDGTLADESSQLFNCLDTPGHSDFIHHVSAALRLVDVAILCVDAAEGFHPYTERLIQLAVLHENIPLVLVLNKVDRLILDLKLPPMDAYRKIRYLIDSVNNVISSFGKTCLVDPIQGSVLFSSARLGFFFSLSTYAAYYSKKYHLSIGRLVKNFWGPITFRNQSFVPLEKHQTRAVPTFVSFILEPLYKILSHSLTGNASCTLSPNLTKLPSSPLDAMKEACKFFFGSPSAQMSKSLRGILPEAFSRNRYLCQCYSQSQWIDDSFPQLTSELPQPTFLAISSFQLWSKEENIGWCICRVLHGTGHANELCFAIDEQCGDTHAFIKIKLVSLWLLTPERLVEVTTVHAGQLVAGKFHGNPPPGRHLLIWSNHPPSESSSLSLSLSIPSNELRKEGNHPPPLFSGARLFPFKGCQRAIIHVNIQLHCSTSAAEFRDAVNMIMRTNPGVDIHLEETGVYVITAMGSMQMESILYTLRAKGNEGLGMALQVSPPFVTFSETVIGGMEESALAFVSGENLQLGFLSSALNSKLADAMWKEEIHLMPSDQQERSTVKKILRENYQWDLLSANSIKALAPDPVRGRCILLDDRVDSKDDEKWELSHQHAIVRGFQIAATSGPLCGEMVQDVLIQWTHGIMPSEKAVLSHLTSPSLASITSLARRVIRQALIGGFPRLLEPILSVHIMSPKAHTNILTEYIQSARGHIISESPLPATTLMSLIAIVPAIDSFGLETQIRVNTNGEAFPSFEFSHWDIVPGDPLDTTVRLSPLEVAKGYQLARDFLLKTRHRKGLHHDIFD